MSVADRSSAEAAVRVCQNCGAWIHQDREECPWCGARGSQFAGLLDSTGGEILSERDLFLEAAVGAGTTDDSGHEAQQRRIRFWLGAFVVSAILIALILGAVTTIGVYQGLQDRTIARRQQAVAYFENGQTLFQEEQYELALAAFQEAVSLEPDFEAARNGLAAAQAALAGTPVPALPSVGPSDLAGAVQDISLLWTQAQVAVDESRWEDASVALEQIHRLDPTFRQAELEPLLFDTHLKAADVYLASLEFPTAIRHFDQALALRPDASDVWQKRQLASAYHAGTDAATRSDWERAITELRRVYLIDPTYLDVEDQLVAAQVAYGDEFWARNIWCEAAQYYRAAVELRSDAGVAKRVVVADERCERWVAATPAPIVVVPEGTELPDVDVEVPTPTPEALSEGVDGEETDEATEEDGPVPTETMEPPLIVTAVPTSPPPAPYPFVLDGPIGEDLGNTCSAHFIRGVVRDATGAAVPGITVRAVDDWGNVYVGVSKNDPPGAYDLPISAGVATYQMAVVVNDELASAVVTVPYGEQLANSPVGCLIVNWLQVR